MVSLIQAIILSIVQGITEWFPISSSGHLALFQQFFGFQNLSFDVFLHFASVLAVIIIFWKDIVDISYLRKNKTPKYLLFFIIALVPAGIVGILFRDFIKGFFSSSLYLGIFFMFSGIIVYLTKFSRPRAIRKRDNLDFFDSIFIGCFQAIAIFPGVSRSGFTISSGLFRGLSKKTAISFSFLLSIPLILGASLLEMRNIVFGEVNYFILSVSFIITF